jgi:hypothetical protein
LYRLSLSSFVDIEDFVILFLLGNVHPPIDYCGVSLLIIDDNMVISLYSVPIRLMLLLDIRIHVAVHLIQIITITNYNLALD